MAQNFSLQRNEVNEQGENSEHTQIKTKQYQNCFSELEVKSE